MNFEKNLSSQITEICSKNNVIIPTLGILTEIDAQIKTMEINNVSINDVVLLIAEAFDEKSLLGVCLKKDKFKDYFENIKNIVPIAMKNVITFSIIDPSEYISQQKQCLKNDPIETIKTIVENSKKGDSDDNDEKLLMDFLKSIFSSNEQNDAENNDFDVENNDFKDAKYIWNSYRIVEAVSDYTGLNVGLQKYEIIYNLDTCSLILGNVEFVVNRKFQIESIKPIKKEDVEMPFTWSQTKIIDKACFHLNIGEDYVENIQKGSSFAIVTFKLNNVNLEVIVDTNYEVAQVKLV